MEAGKKTNVIVWASIAAAAAGAIAVVAIVQWKDRIWADAKVTTHLRDVQDVLSDCYRKIREIDERIPDRMAINGAERPVRSVKRSRAKGDPILDG